MRSLTLGLFAVALLTPSLLAQAPSCTHPEAVFEEPENHAVSVERLLRYHDSGEYEREIREVANSARDFLESRFPGPKRLSVPEQNRKLWHRRSR